MPPRRRNVAPPVLIAAAVATSLVGVLTWAWYAFAATPSETVSEATLDAADPPVVKPRPRSGPKTSLTLATRILPPVDVFDRISSHFDVHLLLPSLPFDSGLLPAYAPTFDRRRLLFHETSEGAVHVIRALGGTAVKVVDGVEGTPLPDPVTERDRVPVKRFVGQLRTFVGDVVVVAEGSEGVQLGKGVQFVGGWGELLAVLGV